MTQNNDDSAEAGENPEWIKRLEDPGETLLETEPHLDIVEITDPVVVENARRTDPKQLEPGTGARFLHVFVTAVVNGRPYSLDNGNHSWFLTPDVWADLGIDDWLGWSGPWSESPDFIRDEFADARTGEFFMVVENLAIRPL